MYCLECNSPLKKRQTKFCSRKCMNVYNARIFKEQHKEDNPEKWRVCDVCNEEKNIWQFSLLDKTRKTTTERKTICKNCSAALNEKERRNRDWKYNACKVLLSNAKQRVADDEEDEQGLSQRPKSPFRLCQRRTIASRWWWIQRSLGWYKAGDRRIR